MIKLGWRTGMRRGEMANLKVKDVHPTSVIVRGGKGNKDRTIPLTKELANELAEFIKDKKPEDSVLGLKAPVISMKIRKFAQKAGLEDFHTHSLRHKFATDLLERGVNIRVVQVLLGHENLNTTQVYLSLTDAHLYDAINKLESLPEPPTSEAEVEGEPDGGDLYVDKYKNEDKTAQTVLSMEQHWKDLAETARKLHHNFEILRQYFYLGNKLISEIQVKDEDRIKWLETDSFLNRCLLQHLQGSFSQLSGINNWNVLQVRELTGELMDVLSAISYGRIPNGTCSICSQ